MRLLSAISKSTTFLEGKLQQGSLYYQPKQCTIIKEIHQNYHTFSSFASSFIPLKWVSFNDLYINHSTVFAFWIVDGRNPAPVEVGGLIPPKWVPFDDPRGQLSVSQTEFWRPVPKSPSHAKAMATGPLDEKKVTDKKVYDIHTGVSKNRETPQNGWWK